MKELGQRKRLPQIPHQDGKKLCSTCRVWIPEELFSRDGACWDGLRPDCKACANNKRQRVAHARGVVPHALRRTPYDAQGRKLCKGCQRWLEPTQFPSDVYAWDSRGRTCKECDCKRQKGYRRTTPASVKNARSRKRYDNNIQYRLRQNLHNRLYWALKGTVKSLTTMELLGCSIEQFKQHLETKFQAGMTWNNHSPNGWHIGHIRDCCSFDLTDEAQQQKCFHFSNLEPQWSMENWSKPRQKQCNSVSRYVQTTNKEVS
jgi:hypothetical protein